MKISFAKIAVPSQGTVALGVTGSGKLGPAAAKLDKRTRGALRRAMKAAAFKGKKGQTLEILTPAGTRLDKVILVGLGDTKSLNDVTAERIGATIYKALAKEPLAVVVLDNFSGAAMDGAVLAARVADGTRLRSYRFAKYRTKESKDDKPKLLSLIVQCDTPTEARKIYVSTKYRTKESKDDKPKLLSLIVQCDTPTEARKIYVSVSAVTDGIFFARDLTSEPPNVIYPASFAARTKELAKDGVKVEVLGEAAMRKLGMGALLGVGEGSARDSKLVVMRWDGAKDKRSAPIAIVGKGVCFDTGGISLKPPPGMWDMKWDMGGAGVVAGLMCALARRKAKVNVVGLCGLVENMPDGAAQRPGDVVTSMSGQTIEVQNTDAEGRLVLADVLWYAQQRFKPSAMIDLATLTGAIIGALSNHYAGLFANDDELAGQLTAAGQATGERLWRFPMGDEYDKELHSLIADMKNIGGPRAGSITAAQFLQRFVKDMRWAHLDIAGVVWNEKGTALSEPGSTGFGVKLLDRFLTENYEG